MNCPQCGHKLSPKQIAKEFASIGGSANTPAQNKARAQNAKLGGWPKGRKRRRSHSDFGFWPEWAQKLEDAGFSIKDHERQP